MIIWSITGLVVAVVFSLLNLLTSFITENDWVFIYMIVMAVITMALPAKYKEKWANENYFRINPEGLCLVFFMILGFENNEWLLYYHLMYDRQPKLIAAAMMGSLVCGFIVWYTVTVIDCVIRKDRLGFLKRSWCYSFYKWCKSKKEARILKKRRSEFKEFLDVIHEMAEGNVDVEFPEKLGAYEDFRPDLMKIRAGIKDAVAREVKSERMKMELVSNVSHDLKTPLTAMITYIDLLKQTEVSEEKRIEYLDIIATRADRLKHLIEDLFEVTKATTGNVKFEPVEMDILNLVRQVTFEFEDKFKDANIEVVSEMPEGRIMVMADSQKTYRVYANLLGNAAKYSMKNSRVYIKAQETDTGICIIIKNMSASRITINPSELTERFVRGDSSRNTEGSGLGLAIAKSFTELQGGTLDVLTDGDLFKVVTTWRKI